MPQRAIIYTRVSKDTSGSARSCTEQEQECRALCDNNGWSVAEVVTDNDVGASRWSVGDRPGFKSLWHKLHPGDVLVVWEPSRVSRNLEDYNALRNLCTDTGVLLCSSGRVYDLTKGDDRFQTGLDILIAEKVAEETRERVLRASRHRATAGKPHGRPPYGYRIAGRGGQWEPDPDTAPIVREIVDRLLTGEGPWRICADLTARGITAPSRGGNQPPTGWKAQRLRVTLSSPSYAGLRMHQGKVVGKATWEPIITEDEYYRLQALFEAKRTRQSPDVVHLLTGIAKCGVCGQSVRYFGPKRIKTPRYNCPSSHVTRRTDKIDQMAVDAIILFFAHYMDRSIASDDSSAARKQVEALRAQLDRQIDEAVDAGLSAYAIARIEQRLTARIEEAEERARRASVPPVLQTFADATDRYKTRREAWDSLDLLDQRDIIRECLDIRIYPQPPMGRRFDPQYVKINAKHFEGEIVFDASEVG